MTDMPQDLPHGMAGVKKIKLDFEFTYSKGGDEDIGDTIVLRAPSFLDLDFNNHMTSMVSKALSALESNSDPNEEEIEIDKDKRDDELRKRALSLMSVGLSEKKYNEYVKYLIKKLTGNSKYAHIEDEDIGISELLWKEIEAKGGKKAIQNILSDYTHFFIQDLMKEET